MNATRQSEITRMKYILKIMQNWINFLMPTPNGIQNALCTVHGYHEA